MFSKHRPYCRRHVLLGLAIASLALPIFMGAVSYASLALYERVAQMMRPGPMKVYSLRLGADRSSRSVYFSTIRPARDELNRIMAYNPVSSSWTYEVWSVFPGEERSSRFVLEMSGDDLTGLYDLVPAIAPGNKPVLVEMGERLDSPERSLLTRRLGHELVQNVVESLHHRRGADDRPVWNSDHYGSLSDDLLRRHREEPAQQYAPTRYFMVLPSSTDIVIESGCK